MANLNKVLLIGNLTRDPQQRFLPSGQGVVEFGLAVNRVYNVNGERREDTTFVDITAWGQQGDTIQRYMTKGSPIFIEGRLKFDRWETKEGEARSKLSVVCERFQFLGGGNRREDGMGGGGGGFAGGGGGGGGRRRGGEEQLDPADFGVESPPREMGGDDVPF